MAKSYISPTVEKILQKQLETKLDLVGQAITKKIINEMETDIGRKTKLSETIKYEVSGNTVTVYSENDIVKFLNDGTKPHKIRPKNGKALAFRAGEVSQYKSGKKINFGDTVLVKEVKHPGTHPMEFFERSIFTSKREVEKILKTF